MVQVSQQEVWTTSIVIKGLFKNNVTTKMKFFGTPLHYVTIYHYFFCLPPSMSLFERWQTFLPKGKIWNTFWVSLLERIQRVRRMAPTSKFYWNSWMTTVVLQMKLLQLLGCCHVLNLRCLKTLFRRWFGFVKNIESLFLFCRPSRFHSAILSSLYLTLSVPIPQNGQTHSINLSEKAHELFECVWSFCSVAA